MHHLTFAALAGFAMAAAAAGLAQPGARIGEQDCAAMAGGAVPPGVTIIASRWVDRGPAPAAGPAAAAAAGVILPRHCQVDGAIDPHVGKDGTHYAIGFMLNLPEAWNGRFLFQGGGGLNGTIRPALGGEGAGELPALARGFAVVSTDSGHKGAVFDARFRADQQAALDFAQGSVGRVTQVAKSLTAHFYGKPPAYSYFAGCSTGGREAMVATQRYPSYFDGVIAGAPAMRTGNSNIALANAATLFAQVAPRDDQGRPAPALAFSAPQKALIVATLLQQCDALDGVGDGMIANGAACRFDLAPITCSGAAAGAHCLSPAQADAVRRAFAAPRNRSGQAIYSAFPFDAGIADQVGGRVTGFLGGAGAPVGPPAGLTIDLDAREDAVHQDGFQALQDTAYWTNVSSFAGHGGKLIFFHGASDPWFSALETVRYYRQLGEDNGGAAAVAAFSRLFLVPGMGHCGGGSATLDRFDALGALVRWVEQGQAPEAIVATGTAFPGRSRPLCPFPRYAHYRGAGDPQAAASFECRL